MASVLEIERRYLIRYPRAELLAALPDQTEIRQTYLLPDGIWDTHRVRRRGISGDYHYTHTRKKRISSLSRIEEEKEISREEYEQLLLRADPERRTIEKIRCCWPYRGQLLEIDLFSFWQDRAILEIELTEEGQAVELPMELEIIREITGDKRYTNASLARAIPYESIDAGNLCPGDPSKDQKGRME